MAIVEVSILPLGTKTPSISYYVSECHKILKTQDKVTYQLTPMGTILEGKLDDCMEIIQQMHESTFEAGSKRVITQVKIDDRRDITATMEDKVESVEEKLKD